MTFTQIAMPIFDKVIIDYHLKDDIDQPQKNPYKTGSIEAYLYTKCWIDTVQWHLEDIIRDPNIEPDYALRLKRRIDKSNQSRCCLRECNHIQKLLLINPAFAINHFPLDKR